MAETRIVHCTRCGQDNSGLPKPPLSGEPGKAVYENVCDLCWGDWFEQSIIVVNHYGLNPALPADRKQLYEVMYEFLGLPPQ